MDKEALKTIEERQLFARNFTGHVSLYHFHYMHDVGALLKEVQELQHERNEWKWEYENACKFTTGFQEQVEALQKENAELQKRYTDWREKYQDKHDKLNLAIEALDHCRALAHSWVIAAETLNCKHTYQDISRTVSETLERIK